MKRCVLRRHNVLNEIYPRTTLSHISQQNEPKTMFLWTFKMWPPSLGHVFLLEYEKTFLDCKDQMWRFGNNVWYLLDVGIWNVVHISFPTMYKSLSSLRFGIRHFICFHFFIQFYYDSVSDISTFPLFPLVSFLDEKKKISVPYGWG